MAIEWDPSPPVARVPQPTLAAHFRAAYRTFKRPLLIAVLLTVALRVLTELVALNSFFGVTFPHVVAHSPFQLIAVWNQWDTGYYMAIAQHGYQATPGHPHELNRFIAFGPAYPAAMWLVHSITGFGLLAAGQIVSALATIGSLTGLVYLSELDGAPTFGGSAALLVVAFPTAFFLLAGYPDSLALACCVWAFIFARHRQWAVAGFIGALAFFTKYYLAIVVIALLVELWQSRPSGGDRRISLRRDVVPALALIGPTAVAAVAWMLFCSRKYGHALAFIQAQKFWGRHFAFPWTLVHTVGSDLWHLRFLDTATASVMELFDTVTILLLCCLAVYTYIKVRKSYGVLLGLALCTFTFQTILYSETREALALFPLFIGLGRWVDGHPWRERTVLALFLPAGYYLASRFVTMRFAG